MFCFLIHIINIFQPSVTFHIETSHLICKASLGSNELIYDSRHYESLRNNFGLPRQSFSLFCTIFFLLSTFLIKVKDRKNKYLKTTYNQITPNVYKMVKYTLKILRYLLQVLLHLFGHFVNSRCHLIEVKIINSINKIVSNIETNNTLSENNHLLTTIL